MTKIPTTTRQRIAGYRDCQEDRNGHYDTRNLSEEAALLNRLCALRHAELSDADIKRIKAIAQDGIAHRKQVDKLIANCVRHDANTVELSVIRELQTRRGK
jgi:hypothetical protein